MIPIFKHTQKNLISCIGATRDSEINDTSFESPIALDLVMRMGVAVSY